MIWSVEFLSNKSCLPFTSKKRFTHEIGFEVLNHFKLSNFLQPNKAKNSKINWETVATNEHLLTV